MIQGHDSPLHIGETVHILTDVKIQMTSNPSTIIFNHCEEMRNIKVSYLPFQHFNKGREIFCKGN